MLVEKISHRGDQVGAAKLAGGDVDRDVSGGVGASEPGDSGEGLIQHPPPDRDDGGAGLGHGDEHRWGDGPTVAVPPQQRLLAHCGAGAEGDDGLVVDLELATGQGGAQCGGELDLLAGAAARNRPATADSSSSPTAWP